MAMHALGRIGSRLRPILGFSRVLQATLSVAQPFVAALIALHGFPSPDRLILGLSAAWAGFMAVFALNDLMDLEVDRASLSHKRGYESYDIDSAMSRHPLAHQQISLAAGRIWIGALATYAIAAAYLLNPPAVLLFLAAATLELTYCKLARRTPLKFLVSGAMVGVGALAGWVAMTDEVRIAEMAALFCWVFAWEIGGRNIVNDFADVEEDSRLGIKTVPLVYGPRVSAWLALFFLVATTVVALVLQPLSHLSIAYLVAATTAGLYLLVWPGLTLLRNPVPQSAMALFNRASLYPPALLLILIASLTLPLG